MGIQPGHQKKHVDLRKSVSKQLRVPRACVWAILCNKKILKTLGPNRTAVCRKKARISSFGWMNYGRKVLLTPSTATRELMESEASSIKICMCAIKSPTLSGLKRLACKKEASAPRQKVRLKFPGVTRIKTYPFREQILNFLAIVCVSFWLQLYIPQNQKPQKYCNSKATFVLVVHWWHLGRDVNNNDL